MTGTELREWMDQYGVTQVELAGAMGKSQPWVARLCATSGELSAHVTATVTDGQRVALAAKMEHAAKMLRGSAGVAQ